MGNRRKDSVMISYNGEEHSLGEWAKILDMPYRKLYKRIVNLKWSAERAFTEESSDKTPVMISYNGEEHLLAEWAKILDIPYSRLKNRITRSKWSIEKAFTESKFVSPQYRTKKPTIYSQWKRLKRLSLKNPALPAGGWDQWSTFEKFENWAIKAGRKEGMRSCKKDVNKPYEPSNIQWMTLSDLYKERFSGNISGNSWKEITTILAYNGERHTLREWESITGISRDTIRRRIYISKWDIGRALSEPTNTQYINRSIKLEYNGQEHTLEEWAEIKNISAYVIYSRIWRSGWDTERALHTPIKKYKKSKVKKT